MKLLHFTFFCFLCIAFSVSYADITNVHASYEKSTFGKSVMGLNLELFRVPERVGKPKVLIVGNIHGDEISGYDLVAHMLQQEPEAQLDVVYVPSMNPDGMYYNLRENADRIDLNRAFPDECARVNSTITLESQAMMDLLAAEKPLVLLVYHGGTSLVVWGPEQNCTSDALSVATDVTAFEFKVMTTVASIYAASLKVPIMEGSVMYQIAGSLPAFAVPRYTQLALTIEVDTAKEPAEKRESYLIERHAVALRTLFAFLHEHVHPLKEMQAKYAEEPFPDDNGYVISIE